MECNICCSTFDVTHAARMWVVSREEGVERHVAEATGARRRPGGELSPVHLHVRPTILQQKQRQLIRTHF